MKSSSNKINLYWFLNPIKNSGVNIYCNTFIEKLSNRYSSKSILEKGFTPYLLYLGLYFPFKHFKILFDSSKIKIFSDESFLILFFFKIKNSILIIQHLPDVKDGKRMIDKIYYSLLSVFERNLLKVDKIVAGSNTTRLEILKKYEKYDSTLKDRIYMIPSSFNFNNKNIKNSAKVKKLLFNKFNISNQYLNFRILLFVGTNEERKNFNILLDIISDLENVILIKIGKNHISDIRDISMDKISKNNLPVYLLEDYISLKDLELFYSISDLFLMPSLKEGFGRPIIEAQGFGLPVICSDIPIFREISNENSVLLVKNYTSKKSWVKKINYLLDNPKERIKLKKLGFKNISRYDINKNSALWEKVLK